MILPLQVSAEPKLHWQRAVDVRIDRAIDDRGRSLNASSAVRDQASEEDEMMFLQVNGMLVQSQSHRPGPVGVRVQRGDKPAARLAELAGAIVAQVRLAEPLARVDAPLKAAGQTIQGTAGVSLKVMSASRRTDSGEVAIGVELSLPMDVQLTANMPAGMPMPVQLQIQAGAIRQWRTGAVANVLTPVQPSSWGCRWRIPRDGDSRRPAAACPRAALPAKRPYINSRPRSNQPNRARSRAGWYLRAPGPQPSKFLLSSRTSRCSDDGTKLPTTASNHWTRRPILPSKNHPSRRNCGMRFTAFFGGLIALTLGLPAAADDKPAGSSPPPANNSRDVKKYVVVAQLPGKLEKVTPASSEGVLEYRSGFGRYAKTEKMDLTFADEVKVWFVNPPEKVDEEGNTHKMTAAELDKIKSKSGPTRGLYAGEMANLHAGQQVEVILGRLKDAPKKPASKEKGAAAEKEFIYVTQIVVRVDDKPPTKPKK